MGDSYQRLQIAPDGAEIEFTDRGHGEVVLLVHAGVFGEWFAPLAGDPAMDGLRVIEMRRAGYTGAPAPVGHLSIGDHARHCAGLLDRLGITAAHVCGHSSSCLMGLQLGLDRPELVRSLVLIEPAPPAFLSGPGEERFGREVARPAMAAAAAGDVPTAFDLFMRSVGGDGYRAVLDAALGVDAHERLLRDARFFFADELPAVRQWALSAEDARRIEQPTLLVQGADSPTRFHDACTVVAGLLPDAQTVTQRGLGHLMPLQDPATLGRVIAEFVGRHPARRPTGEPLTAGPEPPRTR